MANRAPYQYLPTQVLADQERARKADDWATEQRTIVADQWASAHEADFLVEAAKIITPPPPQPTGIGMGPFSNPHQDAQESQGMPEDGSSSGDAFGAAPAPTMPPESGSGYEVGSDRYQPGGLNMPSAGTSAGVAPMVTGDQAPGAPPALSLGEMVPSRADVRGALDAPVDGPLGLAKDAALALPRMAEARVRGLGSADPDVRGQAQTDMSMDLSLGGMAGMGNAGGDAMAAGLKQAAQLEAILKSQIKAAERDLANIQKVRENPRAFQDKGTGTNYAQEWGKLQDLKAKLGQVLEMKGQLTAPAELRNAISGTQGGQANIGASIDAAGAVGGGLAGNAATDEDATPWERAGNIALGAVGGGLARRAGKAVLESGPATWLRTGEPGASSGGLVDSFGNPRKLGDPVRTEAEMLAEAQARRAGSSLPGPAAAASTPDPAAAGSSALDKFLSVWNLPKGLKASLDLSAPFRQGVLLAADKPREFFGAFVPMLRAAKDEAFAKTLDVAIRADERPNLYLAPLDTAELGAREEAFMSNLTNKIPGMAASNRAYVTFLNKLRVDVYDSVVRDLGTAGRDLSDVEKEGLADVINHFTGRGDLPRLGEQAGAILNGLFFSPRFAISRVQSVGDALGALKPGASPASRFAGRAMAKTVGAGAAILTLASLGGAKVETDPRSSSFGKIQVGPNSYDIWGGEQQIARNAVQLLTGERKVLASGEIAPANRLETLGRFAQSKLSPTSALAVGLLQGAGKNAPEGTIGTGYGGQSFSLTDLVDPRSDHSLIAPLGLKDLYEGGLAAIPGLFGVGYQHFDEKPTTAAKPATVTRRPAPSKAPVRRAS